MRFSARTGARAPDANADHGTLGRQRTPEVPVQVLIINAAHLRNFLSEYESHVTGHRPHRALNQASPLWALSEPVDADVPVIRCDRLGGLLHEYAHVA